MTPSFIQSLRSLIRFPISRFFPCGLFSKTMVSQFCLLAVPLQSEHWTVSTLWLPVLSLTDFYYSKGRPCQENGLALLRLCHSALSCQHYKYTCWVDFGLVASFILIVCPCEVVYRLDILQILLIFAIRKQVFDLMLWRMERLEAASRWRGRRSGSLELYYQHNDLFKRLLKVSVAQEPAALKLFDPLMKRQVGGVERSC